MQRNDLFERFPPLGAITSGPVPSYPARGAGGYQVQVHLISRQGPSFHQLAELVQLAREYPPSQSFQVLELPEELAVVTDTLPSGLDFEAWIRQATREARPTVPSEDPPPPAATGDSYTQFFRIPAEPSAPPHREEPVPPPAAPTRSGPIPPPPPEWTPPKEADPGPVPPATAPPARGGDYSEFFRAPVAEVEATSAPIDPTPPPGSPPPPEATDPPPTPGQASESYTAFFRAAEAGTGRDAAPPALPVKPAPPPRADPPLRPTPPPPPPPPAPKTVPPPPVPTQPAIPQPPPGSTPPPQYSPPPPPAAPGPTSAPAAPPREPDPDSITAQFRKPMAPPPPQRDPGRGRDWVSSQRGAKPQALPMGDYLARLDSSSSPRVSGTPRPQSTPPPPSWGSPGGSPPQPSGQAVRPAAPGGDSGPTRRFRTRDIVIFGAILGFVLIAAIVTVVVVLLNTN